MAISAVQRKGKAGLGVTTLSIGSGDGWATPTSGNLLVLTANSDATVSTPSGWTAGPSVVDGNGAYLFYKVSAGTESTVTVTPGSAANTAMTVCEYTGNTASPFDVSNSSTISGSAGTTTTSASVTTTADGDLVVAAALTHSGVSGTAPVSPSWTNSFTNVVTADTGNTTVTVTTFYAELTAGAAGAVSTSASWTNQCNDRQEIIVAFKAAATSSVTKPVVVTSTQTAPISTATVLRSTLADPPVLTTPAPLVVTQPAPKPVANQAATYRSSLVDVPASSTPQPIVASRPTALIMPAPATLSRSSLQDFATPAPIVASRPTAQVVPAPPVIGRNTLQDPPVLTTPAPLVVSRPVTTIVPPAPLLSRSSLVDVAAPSVATPQPIVVTSPFQPAKTTATFSRSTLADPPVLTTPAPLVVTSQTARAIPVPAILGRSSLQDFTTPGPLVITSPWLAPVTAPTALFRTPPAPPPPTTPIAKATSSPAVAANRTSADAVTANRTSSPAVTARATSTGGVV